MKRKAEELTEEALEHYEGLSEKAKHRETSLADAEA